MSLTTNQAFSLASVLCGMQPRESTPQDLPGRYGRVIKDIERLLIASESLSVVAGGWAVWHHGFAGRVTEDVDIVVAIAKLDEMERLAGIFGFDYLQPPAGRWPKMLHKSTGIDVDLLPEDGIPGIPSRPAPIAIRNPLAYRATPNSLHYISLEGLIELKLGAGRAKDVADVVELIKQNPDSLKSIETHLADLHEHYVSRFRELVKQAKEEA